MRRFFALILSLILLSGALLWWQERQVGGVIAPEKNPLVYRSALQSEDWRAFIAPEVISVFPSDTMTDVVLGVEDPIRVRFSSSVRYFFVDFTLDPPVDLIFENNSEKTEFSLLPQTPLQDGVTYTLTVGYRQRGREAEVATDIFHSTFTTLPLPPGTWSADLQTRLVEAKRFTRPQRISGKYIDINLKSQVMTIFEEGNLVDAFVVSSGLAGMDTPKGEYTIHNKALRPWS
ncbi:MAG: L,D-transpeptidase family protein, partial [Candidatus Moranbacteria bacterium]|nr:L,D-transpeptidase family protein [Candidatus Moranbacteria bacterium]